MLPHDINTVSFCVEFCLHVIAGYALDVMIAVGTQHHEQDFQGDDGKCLSLSLSLSDFVVQKNAFFFLGGERDTPASWCYLADCLRWLSAPKRAPFTCVPSRFL